MSHLHAVQVPANEQGSVLEQFRLTLSGCSGVEQLLDTFYFESQNWLSLSGLSFENAPRGHNFDVGVAGRHTCTYRLFTRQTYLGDMVFSRNDPFEDDELHLAEALLGLLILPLARVMGIPNNRLQLIRSQTA